MADDLFNRFISAINSRDLGTVQSLLDRYGLSHPDLRSESYYLLSKSLSTSQINIAMLLLEHGAEVNDTSQQENSFHTPLHYVTCNSHISGYNELISMLLEKGALVDAKNYMGETPLHVAVSSENLEIIELLLNKMADIEAKTNDGWTPLHKAVATENLEIIELLLNKMADIEAKTKDGLTPLRMAVRLLNIGKTSTEKVRRLFRSLCMQGTVNSEDAMDTTDTTKTNTRAEEIVKLLMKRGADVYAQSNDGRTVLEVALLQCKFWIIERISFARPAVKGKVNEHCLRIAVESAGVESTGIAELLDGYDFTLKRRDVKHHGLLHIAVRNGCTKIIEDLLKLGADVEVKHKIANGFTLLHSAAASGRIRIAELLVEHGADVNAKDVMDKTPILYAVENMDPDTTKFFLTNGANDEGKPCLIHTAAMKGHFHIMKMILDEIPSIDVNVVDSVASKSLRSAESNQKSHFWGRIYKDPIERNYKLTALHVAATGGFARVVELLLEHNANVDSLVKKFGTPLHCSVLQRDEAIVEMLLLRGAEVDAKRGDGTTPLHLAVGEGNVKAFKVLMKHGANVHERNNKGLNLVHIAAESGHLKMFEEDLLDVIKAGHPQDNDHGLTALHYAVRAGSLADVEILLRHGADASVGDIHGETPLHYAANCYEESVIEALLDNIYSLDNIDATNIKGRTALRRAVDVQNVACVRLLLFHGCDVNIKDELGETSLEISGFSAFDHDAYMKDHSNNRFENALDHDTWLMAERNMLDAVMIGDQIVKMMVLGLYVNDDNLYVDVDPGLIDMSTFNNGIYDRCKEEIERMKGTKIGESIVSFYEFLTAGKRQLALYSRNPIIAEVLERGDHTGTFKLYCDLIDWRYKKTKIINDLIDSSARSLSALSGYSLSDYDYFGIFGYLRRRDLENLIKAGASDEKSKETKVEMLHSCFGT